MSEHNQRFESFDGWVNKASSWLTRRGRNVHAICFDAQGRLCTCGRDFMRARDDSAFPIRWLWPDQVGRLAALNLEPVDRLVAGDWGRTS